VKSTPAPSEGLKKFFGTRAGHVSLSAIAGYFHATLEGGENIPRASGALIVSNHALFALDAAVLGAILIRDYGRFPRFLADRNLWRIPALRELITAIGALPGEPRAAEELLRQGELVIVYPGGVDDSLKLSSQRYQLQWKKRAGFARVALAAQVPIIPVVGYGIDEMYTVLAREHLIGRRILGGTRYDLPIGFGAFGTILPRRSVQTYLALPQIETRGLDPNSRDDIERIRAATYEALESRLREARESAAHVK
jgi:1-acyl-sn-glycerol-3-phosphate acyltransferase